jgi:small subunit ribosomal protein S14
MFFKQKYTKYNFKDNSKRMLYKKTEKKRTLFKSLFNNRSLSNKLRFLIFIELSKISKNSSKSRIVNRCIFTGRAHSVYKTFRVNRMQLKDLAFNNLIPGIKNLGW